MSGDVSYDSGGHEIFFLSVHFDTLQITYFQMPCLSPADPIVVRMCATYMWGHAEATSCGYFLFGDDFYCPGGQFK